MKVYSEIGVGNRWFISTEYECLGGVEVRVKGFKLSKIRSVYVRYWVGKRVLVVSREGFKLVKKEVNRFKLVLGFE